MTSSILMELKGYAVLAVAGIFMLNSNIIILVVGVLLALYGVSLVTGINPLSLLGYMPMQSQASAGKVEKETPIGFKHSTEGDKEEDIGGEEKDTKGSS